MQDGSDELVNLQLVIGATTPFEKTEVLANNQSWLYLTPPGTISLCKRTPATPSIPGNSTMPSEAAWTRT